MRTWLRLALRLLVLPVEPLLAAATGRIEVCIFDREEVGPGGVLVVIETRRASRHPTAGHFFFAAVPVGRYTLILQPG